MTFAAIDWLSISINLLLVIFVIDCLLMTLLILMQRPKQEGLGAAFGAGVTDQVFGARTTNVLQRGTVYLGSLFFILALTLAVLIGHKNKKTSMLAPKTPVVKVEEKQPAKPAEEVKPKSLSEELPIETPAPAEQPAPAPETAPAAPKTPAPADTAPAVEPTAPPAETAPADTAAPAGETPAAPEEKSGQP
jgi:preprotein translocase subunit SecG